MTIIRRLGFIVGLVWMASLEAFVPIPGLDVQRLLRDADVVVAGTIVDVSAAGQTSVTTPGATTPVNVFTGKIQPSELFKGTATPSGLLIQFVRPSRDIGYSSVDDTAYRCYFLRRAVDHYEFVSPYWPSIVVARSDGNSVVGLTALQRVAASVGRVLAGATSTPDEKMQAVDVLASLHTTEAEHALRRGFTDLDASIRLNAVAADIRIGGTTGLSLAVHALQDVPGPSVPSYVLSNVRSAIKEFLTDPTALNTIEPLARSPQGDTRSATVWAMTHMHTATAIPVLVRSLDDTDTDVVYAAVFGLADVTGQTTKQTTRARFQGEGRQYVDYWKAWGVQRGIK